MIPLKNAERREGPHFARKGAEREAIGKKDSENKRTGQFQRIFDFYSGVRALFASAERKPLSAVFSFFLPDLQFSYAGICFSLRLFQL